MKFYIKYSTIALLLLAAVLLFLLIRSYYAYDTAYFTSPHIAIGIESNYGMICLYCECEAPHHLGLPWDARYFTKPPEDYWDHPPVFFEYLIGIDIGIAHWILIVASTIPFGLRWTSINTMRPLPGVCPTCSYDMRATPDECPECGYKTKQEQS